MKKLALLLLFALPLFAQSPTIIQGPEYFWRAQTGAISYATTLTVPALTSLPLTFFFQSDLGSGTTISASVPSTPATLTIDLIASGSTTVTVSGTTYTYAQVAAILQALVTQARTAQLAASH